MLGIARVTRPPKKCWQSACRTLALICLLLPSYALAPLPAIASTTTLTVTVVYDLDMHRFATSGSFLDAIANPNDASVRCNFAFPQDALSSGATVAMTVYSTTESAVTADAPLPSGKLGANTFYNFSFTNESTGSAITSFDKPITLTFFYSDADISGLDESTVVPYRWDGSSWSALTGYTIDTGANKVTVSTQHFSTFALLGTAPAAGDQASESSGSSGGGGGGGGGIISSPTSAILSGRAYPKSKITVLKDAQIAATTIAGHDANFAVNVSGVSGGNYTFSVYAEDSKGIRSPLLTFPVSVTSGASTKIGGIVVAPTIAVDKSEVRQGDTATVFGQTAPNGEITIAIGSDESAHKTKADQNGNYLYVLHTSTLTMAHHFVRSQSAYGGEVSPFSKSVSFLVGTKNIAAELPKTISKGDVNKDMRVNLVDFSITAYWYKRPHPPASADLSGDGKVDLTDFSIMAFFWTG